MIVAKFVLVGGSTSTTVLTVGKNEEKIRTATIYGWPVRSPPPRYRSEKNNGDTPIPNSINKSSTSTDDVHQPMHTTKVHQ